MEALRVYRFFILPMARSCVPYPDWGGGDGGGGRGRVRLDTPSSPLHLCAVLKPDLTEVQTLINNSHVHIMRLAVKQTLA